MLSSGQFKEMAKTLRSGGGFSVNVKSGKSPETGFMVAAPGSQELKRPSPDIEGRHLQSFVSQNKGELSRSDRYFGGWGGKVVASLDVSQNIAHDPKVAAEYGTDVAHADAREKALGALYVRNEEAAYDLNKKNPDGSTGADLDNPVYDPKRPKNKPGQ
jgi:hypothetical protein